MKPENNSLENHSENAATPMFSIIVPVYNVIGYIEKTIDSILSQSFRDYELIVVDDGSTDGSGIYLDWIVKIDPRIRVFHQDNSGVSVARNLGLSNAHGRWIVFIDGDDAIRPNALQILADCIVRYPEVDLIGYGFKRVTELNNLQICFDEEYNEKIFDCRKAVCYEALNHYMVWGEIFRRDIFANLMFDNLKNGEDVLFCNGLACLTDKYLEIDAQLYLYLQRESSAKLNAWTERRLEDYSLMNNQMLDNMLKCNKSINAMWLKRWVGNLLYYIPQVFSLTKDIQNRHFSRHYSLLKKVRQMESLPYYLKIWLTVATAIKSKLYYRITAVMPMELYIKLINH